MSKDFFNAPVLIAGLPRSGTSLVAGTFHACGLWMGELTGHDINNPKGFFENHTLTQATQKEILSSGGFDPMGVTSYPALDAVPRLDDLAGTVRALLANQGYAFDRPWGLKNAKLTLTWPQWVEVFPAAHWIIVRRPARDVVASCLTTSFMVRHSNDPLFWLQFAKDYSQRLDQLRGQAAQVLEIDTNALITGDRAPLRQAIEGAGLIYDEAAVEAFIEPSHWRSAFGAKS